MGRLDAYRVNLQVEPKLRSDLLRHVTKIEQEKTKMSDLLAGDKRRTTEFLENLAETLRRDARRHLGERISQAAQNNGNPVVMERQAKDQIAEEIPVFFAAKLASFSSEVNHALQQVILPYQDRLDGMVGALRSTAAELFDNPYRATPGSGRLEEHHRPYWVTQKMEYIDEPASRRIPRSFFATGATKAATSKTIGRRNGDPCDPQC